MAHLTLRALVVVFLLATALRLEAQTRHARLIGVEQGLVPAYTTALAQDRLGLLWIGTAGGLYRYDGVELRHWAPGLLRSWVSALVVAPDGVLLALDEDQGGVFTIAPDGAHPLPGPDGAALRGATHLAVDSGGTVWVVRGDEILYGDRAGTWGSVHRRALEGAPPLLVFASRRGGVFALTNAGVWHLTRDGPPRLVARVAGPRHVLELSDGRTLALTFGGKLFDIGRPRPVELFARPSRGIAIAERRGTVWLSYADYLVALPPDADPESLGPEDGLALGGPLLVDHEETLWLGTSSGVMQLPEPDTRIWLERHGLPIAHTRYLAKTGDTVWVNTWRGSAAITRRRGAWRAAAVTRWSSTGRLFVDAQGDLWSGSWPPTPGLFVARPGGVARQYDAPLGLYAFASRDDGSHWFGTSAGLLVAPGRGTRPVRATGLPFATDNVLIHGVLHDRTGRTWLASDRRVCQAQRPAATGSARATWTCDTVPSGHHVSALMETPAGSVWAAFVRGGVWRYDDGEWTQLGDPAPIDVHGLLPSPSGGVWLVRSAGPLRVIEDRATPAGFRVTEELTTWHGLGALAASDVLEEADGTLWLATTLGVARIPAAARRTPAPPRRVVLVDASVDGEPVTLGEPTGVGLTLPRGRNQLTLRFAAASYRDPSRLRYEVRLSPQDQWTPVSGAPVFHWVDLRPGRYQAEVRASLDGRVWTPEPARFAFRVLPPWYATPQALILFVAAVATVLIGLHRARVRGLLRLERQRTRIAMDLHDEMGSGLGSIGILSGVLASETPGDGVKHRRLAAQIAEISQELGTALSDIVWSLGARAATLEAVAVRLAEHGGRLFAAGTTHFAARFPEAWPAAPLEFPLRRAMLLIGLEALHNVARHAQATHVTLTLETTNGRGRLIVEDDGIGLPASARHGGAAGFGLENLRRRAAEIGGHIAWTDGPAGGTRVTLEVPLTAPRSSRPPKGPA